MGKGTTTTDTSPWKKQQPYLEEVFAQAQQAYHEAGKSEYTGDFLATPTTTQNTALAMAKDKANSIAGADLGKQITTNASMINNNVGSGDYRKAASMAFDGYGTDDALQAKINAQTGAIRRSFAEDMIPTLKSQAIAQGAYGGTAFGDVASKAASRAEQSAQDISTNLMYTDMDKRRDLAFTDNSQIRALLPQLQALELQAAGAGSDLYTKGVTAELLPATIMDSIGQKEQANSQAVIDNAIAKYEQSLKNPYAGLAEYASLVAGDYGGTTIQKTPNNTFGQIAATVLGGVNAYSGGVKAGAW
jgi:hypothetical protein